MLNKRMANIEGEQRELRRIFEEALHQRGQTRKESPREGLTPNQRAVFEEIDTIEGKDEAARLRAETLLNTLVGDGNEPVTEAFVNTLKQVLKRREWGIECPTCLEPAAPLWIGSQMVFTHSIRSAPGERVRSVSHSGMSILQHLQLVERRDKRVRRNRLD